MLEDTKLMHKQKKRRAVCFASFLLPYALPICALHGQKVTYSEYLQGLDAKCLLSESGATQVTLESSQHYGLR